LLCCAPVLGGDPNTHTAGLVNSKTAGDCEAHAFATQALWDVLDTMLLAHLEAEKQHSLQGVIKPA